MTHCNPRCRRFRFSDLDVDRAPPNQLCLRIRTPPLVLLERKRCLLYLKHTLTTSSTFKQPAHRIQDTQHDQSAMDTSSQFIFHHRMSESFRDPVLDDFHVTWCPFVCERAPPLTGQSDSPSGDISDKKLRRSHRIRMDKLSPCNSAHQWRSACGHKSLTWAVSSLSR